MGVQGRGKKSEVEELREQVQGMQMQIDELKRARQATQADTEGCRSDTERGAAITGFLRQQEETAHRGHRRRRAPSESDDDEEIPEYIIKREKLAQAARTGAATVPQPLVGLKRKRPFETSQLSDQSDSDLVESTTQVGGQRKRAGHAAQPTRSKRVRIESDSDELSSDCDAAETSSAPRKNHAAGLARNGAIGSSFPASKPSQPKAARQLPVFKPSSGRPLPVPQWTTPPIEPARTFKLPTSSLKPNATQTTPTSKQQEASAKVAAVQNEDSNPYEPSYAEIESFEFKLVVSYSNDGTEYHRSTDLEGNMKSFWSCLKKQRKEWEDAAGAEWAWELQKAKGRVRGKHLCVSSKLAKKPTRWREGDSGNYACRSCATNTLLCFTWVEDEGSEHEIDEEDAASIPKPKGEFWCLPVHPEDRRCGEIKKDREIRTWLNEEDNSESDSSGEDIAESSEEDDFKVGSDYGDLSKSESSSEEEDNAKESDEDDEL